jgi:hypothetical protein
MRFVAIKNLRDGVTLIGRESCDVYKSLDSILTRPCDYSSAVGVSREDHRTTGAFECTIQRGNIVT